jgi:hypothetical protein
MDRGRKTRKRECSGRVASYAFCPGRATHWTAEGVYVGRFDVNLAVISYILWIINNLNKCNLNDSSLFMSLLASLTSLVYSYKNIWFNVYYYNIYGVWPARKALVTFVFVRYLDERDVDTPLDRLLDKWRLVALWDIIQEMSKLLLYMYWEPLNLKGETNK